MTIVAGLLLIACAAAGTIIAILFGALYRLSVERNEECARADSLAAQADQLQADLNAALGRLTRKRVSP